MGPVGGRIIAEVLVGLLQKDPNSYSVPAARHGSPRHPCASSVVKFTMADLLKYRRQSGPEKGGDGLSKCDRDWICEG
jgi:hypothetical protein